LESLLLGLSFAFLIPYAAALTLAPLARLNRWGAAAVPLTHLLILPVWAACALAAQRAAKRLVPLRDPFLLPVGYLLSGLGILTIWRVAPTFGARQTAWLLVGTLALLAILRAPPDLRWLQRYRYLWLLGGLSLVLLTLFLGTNPSGGEPRLWLGCCGIYFQPSEPLRLLLVAFMASFVSRRHLSRRLVQGGGGWAQTYAPLLVIWALSIALLIAQRDLGTGTLLLLLLGIMLYILSPRWQILALIGSMALAGGTVAALGSLAVRTRLSAWLNPWVDPLGGSYQLIQSLMAFAHGGLLGRGPGLGFPQVVPAVHTDFIAAAVGEEWGLLGIVGLLGLNATFVYRGLRIAARQRDLYRRILAAGLAGAMGLQSIMILGGILRLGPLTGVTLPFVSYGGSSLLTSFVALALLLRLSGERGGQFQAPGLLQLQGLFSFAWVALAALALWWTVVRGPDLLRRGDNPRRWLTERYVRRGQIVDRQDRLLAGTTGQPGALERIYPEPSAASVVGFHSPTYGQAGLEAALDGLLHGDEGVDPWRIAWHTLVRGFNPPGADVRLTLDTTLQRAAAQALAGQRGALVVLSLPRGEVLALHSSPSFNPQRLEDNWPQLVQDPASPLLNRATQGRYQPGLVLSPFLLAWATDQRLAAPTDPAPGVQVPVFVAGQELACIYPQTLPSTGATYEGALRAACPHPFAELAQELGWERLAGAFQAFGLTEPPPVPLAVASPPRIAPPQSSEALALEGIGQGQLTVSPLQMARALAALAGDGHLASLPLISAYRPPGGGWLPWERSGEPIPVLAPRVGEQLRATMPPIEPFGQGWAFSALAGPAGERVAWFLGLYQHQGVEYAVTILLEDSMPQEIRQVASQLFLSLATQEGQD
jgi:cell division protein FtsW (lipid II flippase)